MSSNVEAPKGRGRPRKKGFRGRKLNFTNIDTETKNCNVLANTDQQPPGHGNSPMVISGDDITHSSIDADIEIRELVPVALKNSRENACFFNSVAQVFYSLVQFRAHILNTTLENNVIIQLKRLFREMQSSQIVHTYPIILDLHIPQYRNRDQIDASEVVSFLLENCFEKNIVRDSITGQIKEKPDYKLFRISEQTSIMCGNCNKESFTTIDMPFTSLNINAHEMQSIGVLLNETFNPI